MEDYKKEIEKIKGIKNPKFNNLFLGIGIGMFLPLFFLMCYWLWSYRFMSFVQFGRYLVMMKVFAPTLSLSVIPNLGVFFLFLNQERYKTSRGVIFSTILIGGLIMYLKIYVEKTMFQ